MSEKLVRGKLVSSEKMTRGVNADPDLPVRANLELAASR
jgi:hypothetical protein